MALTAKQIVSQSKSALKQWESQWKAHAKKVSTLPMKSIAHFEASGAGRACLLIANGASFEKEIETIKKYQGNVDILVCDKALGHCLDNGIIPTYCLVADANVSFEKYCEKWKDQLKDTILFASVCANPDWALKGQWKDSFFYCVKDAIGTEKIFQPLSNCPNVIAAGTNVSNTMIILLTQCENDRPGNFFGYDKYLLIGFDYCWTWNGSYYAFDFEGKGKRYYMRHNYGRTIAGDYCYTSNNLGFSLSWIQKYIETFRLPVVQCSRDTVFPTPLVHGGAADLAKQMQYKGTIDGQAQAASLKKLREISEERRRIVGEIQNRKRAQFFDFAASL